MNKKLTKDELFLCTLFKLSQGDCDRCVDRYEVGQTISQNNKSVDNTVQILVRTQFVKRDEGDLIRITPHGIRLVNALLELV